MEVIVQVIITMEIIMVLLCYVASKKNVGTSSIVKTNILKITSNLKTCQIGNKRFKVI